MMKRIRREGEALRALLHNRFPAPGGSWTEDGYWLVASVYSRIRHALHPLTEAEQAANTEELLTGKPAPALDDKKDGEE